MTTNNGPMHVFANAGASDDDVQAKEKTSKHMSLRLIGPAGMRQAIGARATVVAGDGSTQTAEVYAGGSYLSQSAPELFFARPQGPGKIDVVWPDGTKSSQAFSDWKAQLEIRAQE